MPGIPGLSIASDAAGIGLGVAQSISGAVNLRKDKAELSRLTPAFYKVQNEYYDNYNQGEQLAQEGLTQSSKDYYGDMMSRGLGTGADAIMRSGGNPNDINKLFDSYSDSARSLSMEDSNQHINNIKYLGQVGKDLAGQKTQQWVLNDYLPYQNKLKELTQRIAADRSNIWGGASTAIGAGSALGTAQQNQSLIDNLFKTQNTNTIGTGRIADATTPLPTANKINVDVPFGGDLQKINTPGNQDVSNEDIDGIINMLGQLKK